MNRKFKNKKFYGSTTIEERGQVFIPKEVRKEKWKDWFLNFLKVSYFILLL